MSNKIKTLFKKLEKTLGRKDFFEVLKNYFAENFTNLIFDVIKLVPFPPYYINVFDSGLVDLHLEKLSDSSEFNQKNGFIIVDDHYIYPITENSIPKYLLIFTNLSNNNFDEINSLCSYIHGLYTLIVNNYRFGFEESSLKNANLISQMSHDINAMISLIETNTPEVDESVSNKMKYAEKMTQDILQYVRDIQILDSEVGIAELLESIIQNSSIQENIEVSTKFKIKDKTINLDVELIDRALNEIIKNAVSAINESTGKINIQATINNFKNLFYKNEFLVIKIEDDGIGINSDFIDFVKNPYFTTRKSEYHSGLGLSIADKIIDAHSGYLNIENTPENKTAVTIYLPLQGKENE